MLVHLFIIPASELKHSFTILVYLFTSLAIKFVHLLIVCTSDLKTFIYNIGTLIQKLSYEVGTPIDNLSF